MLIRPTEFEKCLTFYLIRGKGDKSIEKFSLELELSILALDGTSPVSKYICKDIFFSDEWSSPLVLKQDDLKQKMDVFLSDDVLTIRCRMWENESSERWTILRCDPIPSDRSVLG
ncbi:hypothetical protein AVEN_160236-1 [Araneus ventricosus]|uniref:Uncharacterized protein n=1 Tax=Araneus ventricosus TaxID=182803 RepID=A0A4Y2WQ79_ARAVE|nr:hypothetical protein AVEN_268114-1 [Araneus ventricosus]GBO38856.1 hypothetical protein AVEN_160236-1 [Araneus ventricosus]